MASRSFLATLTLVLATSPALARTNKPPLHGQQWMAITGKPLAATVGAMTFQKGGNAVDAACAMIAATATMWDVLSWGGETQALIYNPRTGKVIGVNALGVAPTGATPEFFRQQKLVYPPPTGPLSAVTPGTPGGIMVMLAEYGKLSLADVLAPSIALAEGYPIDAEVSNRIEANKATLKQWPDSTRVMLTHPGEAREAPHAGEIFRQTDLAATLRKLVAAEKNALAAGKDRKAAIMAAYERFYRGDIAEDIARETQALGGQITTGDLAKWEVKIEEPVKVSYKGIDVYKLSHWQQGPAMLQALNILENFDVKGMGYNSTRYIHTIYQAMSLAFADRDFYYGDPYFPPEEPIAGLLSKDYARERAKQIQYERNNPDIRPGDPYPFQKGKNPFARELSAWRTDGNKKSDKSDFYGGTTSVEAAGKEGWVVSVTPSGGWVPAVIAGKTGIGLSQRAQSFVTDPAENPYNVIAPGKRPRVTLTPTMALKGGKPWLAFAVQGGDSQDQNLLQFFLNVVEFGMTPQEAVEAANINSFQMRESFTDHQSRPGAMLVANSTTEWQREELKKLGYRLEYAQRTSGPINAIMIDERNGSFWGGSSDHGEDYGIGW